MVLRACRHGLVGLVGLASLVPVICEQSPSSGGVAPDFDVPRYAVDLSKPPEQRWPAVLGDFLVRRGIQPFYDFFSAIVTEMQRVAPDTYAYYQHHLSAFEDVYERFQPEMLSEMRVLADALQAHASTPEEKSVLTWPNVFIGQLHIQIENIGGPRLGECTSVVLRPGHGRPVLHMRNWDFGPRPDALGSASAIVDFQGRQGNFTCLLAFTHITKWTTCSRPGAFSMSLNAREFGWEHEHGRKAQLELELLRQGRLPREAVLREVMAARSFKEAVAVASLVRPLTSLYAILADGSPAGLAEPAGAVVSVLGNGSSADVRPMPLAVEPDGWFVVQTNVDHWTPTSQDAYSSHRRDHVVSSLRALGPDAAVEQYYAVLHNGSSYPEGNSGPDDGKVFRPSTIASVMMTPQASGDSAFHVDVWQSLAAPKPFLV